MDAVTRGGRVIRASWITVLRRKLLSVAAVFFGVFSGAHAQSIDSGLRTEPLHPVEFQSFHVAFENHPCIRLFTGNPIEGGAPYESVSVDGHVVTVRVGYYQPIVCNEAPATLRLSVPGLPPGPYQLNLLGRFLFTEDHVFLQSSGFLVMASPSPIPAGRGYTLCTIVTGMLLLAATVLRSNSSVRVRITGTEHGSADVR